MVERSPETPQAEPATYSYLRSAAIGMPAFQDAQNAAEFDSLLVGTPFIKNLGPELVDKFGVAVSRDIVFRVSSLAQQATKLDERDRVANAAAKWARQASKRITDTGWREPEPPRPSYHNGYYSSPRLRDSWDW